MDFRQLERWLFKLEKITPEHPWDKGHDTWLEDQPPEVQLAHMMGKHTSRIQNKYVTQHVTMMWARCTPEQWKELLYVADLAQVPWPDIQCHEHVHRLLAALRAEFPDGDDEPDIAL